MSDPKPAGQGGDKKDKPELFKTRDGSPPKEDSDADDTPKGPKGEKPELWPSPWGTDDRPTPDIDIDKLPPLNKKRFKDDETPDDEDDILGGFGGRRDDKGGPEVLASASSGGFDGGQARPASASLTLNYEEISFDAPAGERMLGGADDADPFAAGAGDSLNYEEIKVTIVAPEVDELGNFEIQDVMAPEPEGWSGSDGDD